MTTKYCDFTGKEFKQKCRYGKVTKTVRVKYNEDEEDVFYLCDKCAEDIAKDAVHKGWRLTARDYVHSK